MHGTGLSNPVWKMVVKGPGGEEFVYEAGTLEDGTLIVKRPYKDAYLVDTLPLVKAA